MDARLTTSLSANLTSNDNLTGRYNLLGTRFAEDKLSGGLDFIGFEGSTKDGGSVFIAGNAGYNTEEDLHGAYSNGLFLKARSSYHWFTTDNNNDDFTKHNAEAGLRFNSGSSTHQNISAFAEQIKKDSGKITSFGGKVELSDGKKSLYGIAGIQKDSNLEKPTPFIGAGIQAAFSTR